MKFLTILFLQNPSDGCFCTIVGKQPARFWNLIEWCLRFVYNNSVKSQVIHCLKYRLVITWYLRPNLSWWCNPQYTTPLFACKFLSPDIKHKIHSLNLSSSVVRYYEKDKVALIRKALNKVLCKIDFANLHSDKMVNVFTNTF